MAEGAKGVGRALYCCFVDFTKAFDRVPRSKLGTRLENLGVPIPLRKAVARLYERVLVELAFPLDGLEKVESNIGVKQGCPLSPTLFGLFIDELEAWLIKENVGVKVGDYILRLLLYADDVVLVSRTKTGLQQLLHVLEEFCSNTGMKVNKSKTKVMVIGSRDTVAMHFDGEILEQVKQYKYLGIDFTNDYRWSVGVEKRIAGGLRALYYCFSLWRQRHIWCWSLRRLMFKVMVQTVVLYGCPAWGLGLARVKWGEIEQVQKRFLLEELGVKIQTPYEMLLAETGLYPLEVEALFQTLTYYQRIQSMDDKRLPKQALQESQTQGHVGWYRHLVEWATFWGIDLDDLPDTDVGLHALVIERALQKLWPNDDLGVKRNFYRQEVNAMVVYEEQAYLKMELSRKKRQLIARLRLSSHCLEIEKGREQGVARELRFCPCCLEAQVEDEDHALLRCPAFDHIREDHQITCGSFSLLLDLSPLKLGTYLCEYLKSRNELLALYKMAENLLA